MSTRTTKREVYALAAQLGRVLGYVPAPASWNMLQDGALMRPTCERDGMDHERSDVLGIMLTIDYAAPYGGWNLNETLIVRRADGVVVPGGESRPFGDSRMSTGEMATALRLARDAVSHAEIVKQSTEGAK
jgi:hypothetical protein